MTEKEIFRKVSLERLSSPEQLDQTIQIVPPKGWMTLIGVGCLLLVVCLWGFLGSIPTQVNGQGIIMSEKGAFQIVARSEGILDKLYVDIGEKVDQGQLVASISQPELVDDLLNYQSILKDLKIEFEKTMEEYNKDTKLYQEGKITDLQYYNMQDKLSSLTLQIDEWEGKIRSLQHHLENTSEIKSPYSGIVYELEVLEGALVEKGDSIVKLELSGSKLQAFLYFPPADGKKIIEGMKSRISPTTVKEEEYGFIRGEVEQVSLFPMSRAGVMRILQNESLTEEIMKLESPIEVRVNLFTDSSTLSGYQWSFKGGPPIKIHSGTLCDGTVVISSQPPVNLVIPLLKKRVLGIGKE